MSEKMIWRGGFGEPYCSPFCYDDAGAKIGKSVIMGIKGRCRFCKRAVHAVAGSDIKLIPYMSEFVFICPACYDTANEFVTRIRQCCMCGKLVMELTPEQVQGAQSFTSKMLIMALSVAVLGALVLGGAMYWNAALGETAAVLVGLIGAFFLLISLLGGALLLSVRSTYKKKEDLQSKGTPN